MTDFITLSDINLTGRTVVLRADLNVPFHNGRVTDLTRIERILPTLKELKAAGCRVAILSHFGRPEGKKDMTFTLKPIAQELQVLRNEPVQFLDDCVGEKVQESIKALSPGQIAVLENTRFYAEEEANDPTFAQSLAALGDLFVNDAFSASHRAHASTEGIAHHLQSVAGRLMEAELNALTRALTKPDRPVAAIIGGAKVSTKLKMLKFLLTKVDMLIIGGAMANTFLKAKGIDVGKSLTEDPLLSSALEILKEAEARGCHLALPKDCIVAQELTANIPSHVARLNAIPKDAMILDIGPDTIKSFKEDLRLCKTVVWNGPLGAFEIPPFDRGTQEIAITVADLTKRGIILSVAGGGDTVSALSHAGVTHGLSYLSSAGGAFLEWLEGHELPGVAVLKLSVPKIKIGKVII